MSKPYVDLVSDEELITEKYNKLKEKIKILFVITSCKPNLHLKKFYENKLENFVFLVGDLELKEKYVLENNILYVKANDKYLGLPEKIIMSHEAFLNMECFNKFTHLYKIDDVDYLTYQSTELNYNFLRFIDENPYCGTMQHMSDIVRPELENSNIVN